MRIKSIIAKFLPKRFVFCYSRHSSFGLSLVKKIKAAIYGFTSDEWVIFELDKNNRKEYLSEYDRYIFRQKALSYRIVFDNKLLFYNVMKGLAPLNKLYAYKAYGRYVSCESGFEYERIIDRIKDNGKIVYKPTFEGGGGKNFVIIEYEQDLNKFTMNRIDCTVSDIENLLCKTDNYILEEYCRQSDFENLLFPDTVNTLRIITVEDEGAYKPVVIMQRIGSVKNACADNASLGGLFCEVDIQTGELSSAFSYAPKLLFDKNGKKRSFPNHPTTGCTLKGKRIPNFEFIKSEACRIHEAISYTGAKFVAWDFALTDDGYRVIEGNTSSGMKFIQFHKGARYSEIGRWMYKNGYIIK